MATLDVISLDEAKDAINMTGSGAEHGLQLQTFLSAVSELLDDVCGPIVQRDVTETLVPRGGLLFPTYTPIASVTTVTEYVSGTATVLTGEDIDTVGGYLLRDNLLARRSSFMTINWNGDVVVEYVAGRYASTDEVGARFKLAAQEILAREWPQYAAAWSRGGSVFDAPEGSLGYFRSVEPVVNQWLAGERRAPAVA